MPRLECITILEAGSFETDSGTVIIPSGEEPFPTEEFPYSLRFMVRRNSPYIAVVGAA